MKEEGDVEVDLPSGLTAPHEARAATRRVLPGWRLSALLDPVLLVVSELVGNAVRHGRPPVAMRLRRSGGGVRISVHDGDGRSLKSPQSPEADAESGRGMLLVQAVSADSGIEQIEGDGKVVWARVEPEPDRG